MTIRSRTWRRRLVASLAVLTAARMPRRRETRIPEHQSVAADSCGGSGASHDAAGESLAAGQRRSRHSAPRRTRIQLVERGAARRESRRHHRVPRAHRPGRDLRCAGHSRDGPRHRHRGTGRARRCDARRRVAHLSRPRLLGAQHQYLPRSALGPRPGNLRRGSLPHRAHGRRLRHGPAGHGSRATTSRSPRRSISSSTAVRSRRVTSPTSMSANTTWKTRICRHSAPPSWTATPDR